MTESTFTRMKCYDHEDFVRNLCSIEEFVGGPRQRGSSPDPEEPINYEEARDRYVKGFVTMATYQCDALVEKFKVTPLIIGLVGPICLRFVSLSRVFDNDTAEKAIRLLLQSEGVRRKRCGTAEEPDDDLNDGKKRAITTWVRLLKKSLPLSAALAISYLACEKAGVSIPPVDIVSWANQGKIPSRSCYRKIQEQMGTSKMIFSPFEIISGGKLIAEAMSIADGLPLLPLPSVDLLYGTASNYLKRLSITPPAENDDKKILLDLVHLIQNWSIDKLGVQGARSSGIVARKMDRKRKVLD